MQTTLTQGENQATADRREIEILSMPAELDLATGKGVVEQSYAAIARSARLPLDLIGLSFCDARNAMSGRPGPRRLVTERSEALAPA